MFSKWPQGEWHPCAWIGWITVDYVPNRWGSSGWCYSRFSLIYIESDLLEWNWRGASVLRSHRTSLNVVGADIAFWYDHRKNAWELTSEETSKPSANRSRFRAELKTYVTWSVCLFLCRNENSPPDDLHLPRAKHIQINSASLIPPWTSSEKLGTQIELHTVTSRYGDSITSSQEESMKFIARNKFKIEMVW